MSNDDNSNIVLKRSITTVPEDIEFFQDALPELNGSYKEAMTHLSSFFLSHSVYEAVPENSKILVFNSKLSFKKMVKVFLQEDIYCALIYDSQIQNYIGLLTISDILLLFKYIIEKINSKNEQILEFHLFLSEIFNLNHDPTMSYKNKSNNMFIEENFYQSDMANNYDDNQNNNFDILKYLDFITYNDYLKTVKNKDKEENAENLFSISLDANLFDALKVIEQHSIHRLIVEETRKKYNTNKANTVKSGKEELKKKIQEKENKNKNELTPKRKLNKRNLDRQSFEMAKDRINKINILSKYNNNNKKIIKNKINNRYTNENLDTSNTNTYNYNENNITNESQTLNSNNYNKNISNKKKPTPKYMYTPNSKITKNIFKRSKDSKNNSKNTSYTYTQNENSLNISQPQPLKRQKKMLNIREKRTIDDYNANNNQNNFVNRINKYDNYNYFKNINISLTNSLASKAYDSIETDSKPDNSKKKNNKRVNRNTSLRDKIINSIKESEHISNLDSVVDLQNELSSNYNSTINNNDNYETGYDFYPRNNIDNITITDNNENNINNESSINNTLNINKEIKKKNRKIGYHSSKKNNNKKLEESESATSTLKNFKRYKTKEIRKHKILNDSIENSKKNFAIRSGSQKHRRIKMSNKNKIHQYEIENNNEKYEIENNENNKENIENKKPLKYYTGFITYETIFDFLINNYYGYNMKEFDLSLNEIISVTPTTTTFLSSLINAINYFCTTEDKVYTAFEMCVENNAEILPILNIEKTKIKGFLYLRDYLYYISNYKCDLTMTVGEFLGDLYKGIDAEKPYGKERIILMELNDENKQYKLKELLEKLNASPEKKIILYENNEGEDIKFSIISLKTLFNSVIEYSNMEKILQMKESNLCNK